jgi:hypothetical protein
VSLYQIHDALSNSLNRFKGYLFDYHGLDFKSENLAYSKIHHEYLGWLSEKFKLENATIKIRFQFSFAAIALVGYCLVKLMKNQRSIQALKLGRDGERAVGEFLERQRENGYRLFHDIVGGDFNIDHILIGQTGVYTIETKTISKPVRGNPEIQYDGEKIKIGRYELNRNPVIQAKAQANWIKELIGDLTGRQIKVQPVVLFPGWYCKQPLRADVWVLNPKALPKFLEKSNPVLTKEDVHSVSTHLSRYVRNTTV